MDTRNGNLYDSRLAALADDVPNEAIEQVEVITIQAGPFKGRTYVKNPDGSLGRRVQRAPRPAMEAI